MRKGVVPNEKTRMNKRYAIDRQFALVVWMFVGFSGLGDHILESLTATAAIAVRTT
jgi:hypothetical protein